MNCEKHQVSNRNCDDCRPDLRRSKAIGVCTAAACGSLRIGHSLYCERHNALCWVTNCKNKQLGTNNTCTHHTNRVAQHSKYHREIKPGVWVDVYDVINAFMIVNPALAHAIKKMLAPGKRGAKSVDQDLSEAIHSIVRAKEMLAND